MDKTKLVNVNAGRVSLSGITLHSEPYTDQFNGRMIAIHDFDYNYEEKSFYGYSYDEYGRKIFWTEKRHTGPKVGASYP